MSTIDDIKDRIDAVDLISETVKLRKSGKNYMGFCPFHENTRTPAFVVFPDSGTWRCFGQCNEGGDIFRYVMKKEGWDFQQALQYLAQKAGVVLEPLTPEKQEREEKKDRLTSLLEDSQLFYQHHLLNNPAGKHALDYITRRGVTRETIISFGLGYAPEGWDNAINYFKKKGYTEQEMLDAGLVTEKEGGGKFFDRFRNRLLFPIHDNAGRMVGYGARALAAEDNPKYLNSPQTALFDKGRLLYGLHKSIKSIRAKDQVVIVEGYMDVIGLHQAGFDNAVSPMGTALNEHQFRQLKRYTRRIVLALDPDAAGEKATMRGLELARQSLDRGAEIVADAGGIFDSHGLIRSEGRLQADLRVTTLPDNKDPDEIVLEDKEAWVEILENAKPIVQHVMDTLISKQNIADPKVKSAILDQMVPLIKDLNNEVERTFYAQKLARDLQVDERLVSWKVSPPQVIRNRPSRRQSIENLGSSREPTVVEHEPRRWRRDRERHCLKILLTSPESMQLLDRALQNAGLSVLDSQDFEDSEHQMLVRLIEASLEQDDMEPVRFIELLMPPDLEELYLQLTEGEEKKETDEKDLGDLLRTFVMLRRHRLTEELLQVRYLQEEMNDQSDPPMIESYRKMIMEYTKTRARLDSILNGAIRLS